jgi:para-aminobenzoate synthetase component 1
MNPTISIAAWDAPEPEAAFARLEGRRGAFWLDSSLYSGGAGRHSIMGCEPFGVFRARAGRWEFDLGGRTEERGRGDPGEALERLLETYRVLNDTGRRVPFCGGAVGFLGYDFGRAAGRGGAARGGPPDAHFGWYDAAAIWDHDTGLAWLVGAGWRRAPESAAAELEGWLSGGEDAPAGSAPPELKIRGDFTRARYAAAVGEVRARIADGEIYQMNLAQRFTCATAEPPARIYRRLRALNPAPMGAFLEAGDWTVLSSSPERFLEVEGGRIRTFPIKGTRPRGGTPADDAAQLRELAASEKERAELLMIVDLMRNDLGRVCRFGSVRVKRLHDLKTFATVHHLEGEVEGDLRPGVGAAELLRAVFPGGSITGAPKVRAMTVIDELEPVSRGIFSGSIGYWSACGRIDLNIAIRTIVCHRGRASFHVGAGIVWDSDPEFEYEETLAKGRALLAALGATEWPGGRRARSPVEKSVPSRDRGRDGRPARPATPSASAEPSDAKGVFETVLLAGGHPVFFDEHRDRFAAGCAYFGLKGAPEGEALRSAAAEAIRAAGIPDGVLRWSAWEGGHGRAEWAMRVEPPRPHMLRPEWRAEICATPLPGRGPESACKHLGRRAWLDALASVRAAGGDEAVLVDAAGHVVEGAVSNVFCVRGGRLFTPSLACRPLPGIVRSQVLSLARGMGLAVEEAALTAGELEAADEVFITNSLIGLRPVALLGGRRLAAPGPTTRLLQAAYRTSVELKIASAG